MLVAVDNSENSRRALRYVGRMVKHLSGPVTLLHVVPSPNPDLFADQETMDREVKRREAEGRQLLSRARDILGEEGVDPGRVTEKLVVAAPPLTVAEAVLSEQSSGGYETVVLGRRGMTPKEEFLFGSVSSAVVRRAKGVTVWVVE